MEKSYKRIALLILLIFSMFAGLVSQPAAAIRTEAETKLSATAQIDAQKVNKKTYTMQEGSSKKINLLVTPKKSKGKIKYQSGKKSVVSVSKTGTLKAKKEGTAKITVKVTGKGNQKKKIWFKVNVIKEDSSDKKTESTGNGTPCTLTVGGQTFQAVFYDNKTANALLEKMPMTLTMKELNGNEKYYYFDTQFPTNEKSPGKISAGDIKLYGSDCLVAFYKSFTTSYRYTSIGYVEDVSGFVKAVGNGNVKITFQK